MPTNHDTMPIISDFVAQSPEGRPSPRVGSGSRGHRWTSNKRPYHHGSLRASAIQHGMALVAKSGPMAVTMRGVARDLGVSAAALVYFFHNRAGLRAAIAHAAAELMRPYSVVRSGGEWAGIRLKHMAGSMVEFATANPNLYRVIYGEGWRDGGTPTPVRRQFVYSIDRIANMGQASKYIRPGPKQEHAWLFHAAAHGLAMCAADGSLPKALVEPILSRFVNNLYQAQPHRASTLPPPR